MRRPVSACLLLLLVSECRQVNRLPPTGACAAEGKDNWSAIIVQPSIMRTEGNERALASRLSVCLFVITSLARVSIYLSLELTSLFSSSLLMAQLMVHNTFVMQV